MRAEHDPEPFTLGLILPDIAAGRSSKSPSMDRRLIEYKSKWLSRNKTKDLSRYQAISTLSGKKAKCLIRNKTKWLSRNKA